MTTDPPTRRPDPMHTARLMEAVDTLSKEGKRLPEPASLKVTLALLRVREALGLL